MYWSCAVLAFSGLANAIAVASSGSANTVTFTNDRRFLFDTDGQQIDAYGSKVNYFNGAYYLYGNSFSDVGTAYGVKSYVSNDLSNWKANGNILSANLTAYCYEGREAGGCGRPHIVYHQSTSRYILWLNAYQNGYVIATSSSPAGPFEQVAGRALIDPQFDMLQPADFTVETNGTSGWLVHSALNFRSPLSGSIWPPIFQTLHISPLTGDFMNTTRVSYPVTSAAMDLIDQEAESPDLFYRNGYYYVSASNTCGYCNGSIGLLYRATSIEGPWTRQILSGDSCQGQVEGVLPLTNPSTGAVTYVWHSTSVPGGPRVGFGGHIFQPLVFNADGSAQPLNCASSASFTVPFTPGTQSLPSTGSAQTALTSTPSSAAYTAVCDSDSFDLFQTFTVPSTSTLKSVSVNLARAQQSVPLTVTVFNNFTSDPQLVAPGFKYNVLGSVTLNTTADPSALRFTFDTVTVPVNTTSGAAIHVTKGDLIGIAIAGADYSPYCHLEYDTNGAKDGIKLFQRGVGQNSWRGIDGKTSIVYERAGKGIKFFASYA